MNRLSLLWCILLLFSCELPHSQYRLATYYRVPDSMETKVEECTKAMLKELSNRTTLESDDMKELLESSHALCIRNYSRPVPTLERKLDGYWVTVNPQSLTKAEKDTLAELMWGKTFIDKRASNPIKPL